MINPSKCQPSSSGNPKNHHNLKLGPMRSLTSSSSSSSDNEENDQQSPPMSPLRLPQLSSSSSSISSWGSSSQGSQSSEDGDQCNILGMSKEDRATYNTKFARYHLESHRQNNRMRWNFDFDHNRPLDDHHNHHHHSTARYQWEPAL